MEMIYPQLSSLLLEVERHLREMELWSDQSPSAQSMASSQPFAVDTMEFTTWLQFIFLPRMYAIVEAEQNLPASCAIAPMAEQYFTAQVLDARVLVVALEEIDQLITQA